MHILLLNEGRFARNQTKTAHFWRQARPNGPRHCQAPKMLERVKWRFSIFASHLFFTLLHALSRVARWMHRRKVDWFSCIKQALS